MLTSGEPGIAGFTIKLHNGSTGAASVVATATTNASGVYTFPNLAFGTYYIEEVDINGWQQVTADAALTVSSASSTGTLNFANIATTTTKVPKGKAWGFWHNFFGNHFNFFGHKENDHDSKGFKVTQPVKVAPIVNQKGHEGNGKHER